MANFKWVLALALGACHSAAASPTRASCQSFCNFFADGVSGAMACVPRTVYVPRTVIAAYPELRAYADFDVVAELKSRNSTGQMPCLNKDESARVFSLIQNVCMVGCYDSHVYGGVQCAKEFALRHLSVEMLVSLVASLSALVVVVLGKRCRRMEWPRIRLPTVGRANRNDLLLDLESPLLLGEDYAPAPPASPPALLLPETRDRASSI